MHVTEVTLELVVRDSKNYQTRGGEMKLTLAFDPEDDVEFGIEETTAMMRRRLEATLVVGPYSRRREKPEPEELAEVRGGPYDGREEEPIKPAPPAPIVRDVAPAEPAPDTRAELTMASPAEPESSGDRAANQDNGQVRCSGSGCRRLLTKGQHDVSVRTFKRPLCPACQKMEGMNGVSTPEGPKKERYAEPTVPPGVNNILPHTTATATPQKGVCAWCNGTGMDKDTSNFCTCPKGMEREREVLTAKPATGNRPKPA